MDTSETKRKNIARLTAAALYSITGKAKILIEETNPSTGLISWADKKKKLYNLYDKYTKRCSQEIDSTKSIDEMKKESTALITSYIENISEMI